MYGNVLTGGVQFFQFVQSVFDGALSFFAWIGEGQLSLVFVDNGLIFWLIFGIEYEYYLSGWGEVILLAVGGELVQEEIERVV